METIKLTYNFDGPSIGETKNITLTKTDEHGIHDYEVCELFMDFMKSATSIVGSCHGLISRRPSQGISSFDSRVADVIGKQHESN